MASLTFWIFSAASSGISMLNASSNAMTSSTVSRESAPRSSTKEASGVTSLASTPSCSTMMLLTFSSTLIRYPFLLARKSRRILAQNPRRGKPGGRETETEDVARDLNGLSSSAVYRLPSPGSHIKAPRHIEDGAGDVGGFVGGEEGDRGRDVVGAAETAERDLARKGLAGRVGHLPGHRGRDESRGHGIAGDVAGGELPRDRLGQSHEPGLRGGVVGLSRVPDQTHDGRHVDDTPVAFPKHSLHDGLRQQEDAGQIRGEDTVPGF